MPVTDLEQHFLGHDLLSPVFEVIFKNMGFDDGIDRAGLFTEAAENTFEQVDVIMGPTAPSVAFKLGEKADDPVSMYLSDIYTIAVNLAGLPAMSVPAGLSNGMPVGLHLVGNYFEESRLLNAGHQYQQVSDWHTRTPQGFE